MTLLPHRFRSLVGAALLASFAAPCVAQLQHALPMASGSHSWGTPYWTEDVLDPAAEAGVVDHLNYVHWLDIHSQAVTLQPGTYMAQMRIAKVTSTVGQYDLTVRVEAGGTVLGSTVLPVAMQTLDTYVWSPEVVFTIHQPTVVDVVARNTSNVQQKRAYRFDTARIGRIPLVGAVASDSLDTWGYANASYFDSYVAEPGAVYGRVSSRNSQYGLTWMDLRKVVSVPAGGWVFNVRLRNRFGPGLGAEDLTFAAFDSLGALVTAVTIPAAEQLANQWVLSPNLRLDPTAQTDYTFAVFNHGLWSNGYGYEFDSFSRRPSAPGFTTYGQGCGGITLAQTAPANIGQSLGLEIQNAGAGILGAFVFGQPIAPAPLDFLGAVGCLQHVNPTATLTAFVVQPTGTCSLLVPLPAMPELIGYLLDVQGAVLAPSAPGSVWTSNAAQVYVGQ